MKVRYIGPHDRVRIEAAGVELGEVDRGGVIDVPDMEGERMLEQPSNWERVAAPANPKDKKGVEPTPVEED